MKCSFHSRRYDFVVRDQDLSLYWEVEGSSISDNYTPEEIDEFDLLRVWIRSIAGVDPFAVPIYWYVEGDGTFECAPESFAERPFPWEGRDFLEWFRWPVGPDGERIQFARLPVVDLSWNEREGSKGGFITEATGWKPSPFQATVDLVRLLRASGIAFPERDEMIRSAAARGRYS